MTEDPGQTNVSDPGSDDSSTAGGQPNSPYATATSPLPQGSAAQSTHNGGLVNNGTRGVRVMITAKLDDGQGNSPTTSTAIDAGPGTTGSFQPITMSLPFSNYQSGTTVTFIATTTVTDGTTSATDSQRNDITIP